MPVPEDLIVFGEIGLAGECRSVSNTSQRVNEALRLGFKRIALPHRSVKDLKATKGVEIIPIKSVYDLTKLISEC